MKRVDQVIDNRVSRWRTVMCGVAVLAVAAIATLSSTIVAADMGGQSQSIHGHELAIKRSTPNGRPDIIKA
jgi:hypothetical protein